MGDYDKGTPGYDKKVTKNRIRRQNIADKMFLKSKKGLPFKKSIVKKTKENNMKKSQDVQTKQLKAQLDKANASNKWLWKQMSDIEEKRDNSEAKLQKEISRLRQEIANIKRGSEKGRKLSEKEVKVLTQKKVVFARSLYGESLHRVFVESLCGESLQRVSTCLGRKCLQRLFTDGL